ncbi:ABC transporter ATP-binding protein [soil metagenome]
MSILLCAQGVTKRFRGLLAVDQIDLEILTGSVHGIIGPNGAGKTTLFNLISGLLTPTSGSFLFDGRDVTAMPPYARTRLGLARTFQNIRMFADMSVIENVLTGMHTRLTAPGWMAMLGLPPFRAEERTAKARAAELLEFVGLTQKANHRSGDLAYGEQRRLEIARALASEPRLLLLDEPAAGMNPAETRELAVLLKKLGQRDVTVLLVEHNMGFVMDLCDRITVLNFGGKIAEGNRHDIRNDPVVISAYLGAKVAERLARGQI